MGVATSAPQVETARETTHALTWTLPERKGQAPSPRNGHTADLLGSRVFLFAGGDKADLLNDLHVFDVRTSAWQQPPTAGMPPSPRSRHTCVAVDHRLFIWGGIGGGTDVHVLDTRDMSWSTPRVQGDPPDSRFGHSAIVVHAMGDTLMVVIGGHNSREALSDVHVLDASLLRWKSPDVIGEAPICGNRHATVQVERVEGQPPELLIFAADMHETFQILYALQAVDSSTMRWAQMMTTGARGGCGRARGGGGESACVRGEDAPIIGPLVRGSHACSMRPNHSDPRPPKLCHPLPSSPRTEPRIEPNPTSDGHPRSRCALCVLRIRAALSRAAVSRHARPRGLRSLWRGCREAAVDRSDAGHADDGVELPAPRWRGADASYGRERHSGWDGDLPLRRLRREEFAQ